jgi:hypothetical protein
LRLARGALLYAGWVALACTVLVVQALVQASVQALRREIRPIRK